MTIRPYIRSRSLAVISALGLFAAAQFLGGAIGYETYLEITITCAAAAGLRIAAIADREAMHAAIPLPPSRKPAASSRCAKGKDRVT